MFSESFDGAQDERRGFEIINVFPSTLRHSLEAFLVFSSATYYCPLVPLELVTYLYLFYERPESK